MTISSNGGQPRELPAFAPLRKLSLSSAPVWTTDSRYLLCNMGTEESEWFAFPVDGGNPLATGAGGALRAAGIGGAGPYLMTGDRVLFGARVRPGGRLNIWEIRLSPDSRRVQGVPHQLTFGTQGESPNSSSATGTVALEVYRFVNDFYLLPLTATTGQPAGVARRLTRDGRFKNLLEYRVGGPVGDPGSAYFGELGDLADRVYALDLVSSRQTLVIAKAPVSSRLAISPDGRQVAYSVAEGDSYSIRLGSAATRSAEAPVLCRACGKVLRFSPDGRFLFYNPEAKVKDDPQRKLTVQLLDVASGKSEPWLEDPADSAYVADSFDNGRWLGVWLGPPGSRASWREYLVPWREGPVPQSEWIRTPWSDATVARWTSPTANFVYFFEGSKLMTVGFDPQRALFNEPEEVKFVPGSAVTPRPDSGFTVRGPGLVFSVAEKDSSVWLMKLPR